MSGKRKRLSTARITGYLNRCGNLPADNPVIAWKNDGDTRNDRCVLLHDGDFYYNPAIPAVREPVVKGVEEVKHVTELF